MENKRLLALDAFRGFTVAAMIVVNYPGSWEYAYTPLRHAEWGEFITPTDLIFPFFIFIVGVSIVLAFSRQVENGVPKKELRKKIIIRSIKIFALGVFLNVFPAFDFSEVRIPGVLQRIALVFFACSFLYLSTDWRGQLKTAVALLLSYWALMMLVPVPNLGAGVLEPGKNLAAYIDSLLIPGKMWEGNWDPEGVLSTLPAIATGIAGMLVGQLLVSNQSQEKKINWIFFSGFCATVIGLVWGWFFPINKHIWTSSYAVYTAGLASLTLAASIWFVDVLGFQRAVRAGVIFGSNAVAAYVIAGILHILFYLGDDASIHAQVYGGLLLIGFSQNLSSLTWSLLYCAICFVPVYVLWRKKIFIKL